MVFCARTWRPRTGSNTFGLEARDISTVMMAFFVSVERGVGRFRRPVVPSDTPKLVMMVAMTGQGLYKDRGCEDGGCADVGEHWERAGKVSI